MKKLLTILFLVLVIPASGYTSSSMTASINIWKPLIVNVTQELLMPTIYTTNRLEILSTDSSAVPQGENGHNGIVNIAGEESRSVRLTVSPSITLTDGTNNLTIYLSVPGGLIQTLHSTTGLADFSILGALAATPSADRSDGVYTGVSTAITVLYD